MPSGGDIGRRERRTARESCRRRHDGVSKGGADVVRVVRFRAMDDPRAVLSDRDVHLVDHAYQLVVGGVLTLHQYGKHPFYRPCRLVRNVVGHLP